MARGHRFQKIGRKGEVRYGYAAAVVVDPEDGRRARRRRAAPLARRGAGADRRRRRRAGRAVGCETVTPLLLRRE